MPNYGQICERLNSSNVSSFWGGQISAYERTGAYTHLADAHTNLQARAQENAPRTRERVYPPYLRLVPFFFFFFFVEFVRNPAWKRSVCAANISRGGRHQMSREKWRDKKSGDVKHIVTPI